MKKSIWDHFNVKVKVKYNGIISLTYPEGFTIEFTENPGLPDIIALYWYIHEYKPQLWDTIVDGGWYHGLTAMFFSKLVGNTGKVIVFEPDEKNFNKLKKNIALNKLTNIIAVNKWLYDKDATLAFNNSGEMFSSLVTDISNIPPENISKIDVVNLGNELERLQIEKVHLIKMDIEGAEIEAIHWLLPYLQSHPTNLAIASYHVLPGSEQSTSIELEKMFQSIWYETYSWWPHHLTTYAHYKK